MSVHIVLRLVFFCLFAIIGWQLGVVSSGWSANYFSSLQSYYYAIISFFIGIIGFFLAPYLTIIPYRVLRRQVVKASARAIIMGVTGTIVGLVIAALLAFPLSMLPGRWGQITPMILALLAGALGAMTMIMREKDILGALGLVLGRDRGKPKRDVVLLDTSVIIDGRVADIRQTGFISGVMIVPRFVLDELQHIADSSDVLRRNRGRRGLDILNRMQKDETTQLEISDMDARNIREVDGKLIKLAQELDCPVLTNDYNLNRVAELQGVQVLNINELANAVKAVMLPGETLPIQIIQEGKEHGQGVGYLDDGTMVVVEDGRRYLDSTVVVVVTRVLQTVAGRMIFGQIQDGKK